MVTEKECQEYLTELMKLLKLNDGIIHRAIMESPPKRLKGFVSRYQTIKEGK